MKKKAEPDILILLCDLHKQATTERSHYYTADILVKAIREIIRLRDLVKKVGEK